MSHARAVRWLAVVLAVLAVAAVACGDDGDALGVGGLPTSFPVPDGAAVRFSMAGIAGSAGGLQVELAVARSAEEVRAWYADRLPDAGYDVTDRGDALEVRGHGDVGAVTIAPADDGGTRVRVVLEPA